MKQRLKQLLAQAADDLRARGALPIAEGATPPVQIERARDRRHGDFASNLAMTLAKSAKQSPRTIAEQLVAALPPSEWVERAEIAGPG
ncbi:MAG: arginine--tRNA ligase, partial [bacterium]